MSNSKPTVAKGFKYFAIALPLLFGAPILITIGFKALKDGKYIFLILGVLLGLLAIFVTSKAVSTIMKALFDKNEEE